jgi:hypothetical protein
VRLDVRERVRQLPPVERERDAVVRRPAEQPLELLAGPVDPDRAVLLPTVLALDHVEHQLRTVRSVRERGRDRGTRDERRHRLLRRDVVGEDCRTQSVHQPTSS